MKKYRNILVIRLAGMGDIIFTLPAIQMLRDNLPDCRLTYLTTKNFADLLQGFPRIDQVLTIDRALYHRKILAEMWGSTRQLIGQLRNNRFDLVIDFQGFNDTAILAWLSGSAERWGFLRKAKRQPLYTFGYQKPPDILQIDWNREMLKAGGMVATPVKNEFMLPSQALQSAEKLLAEWQLQSSKPTLFIQPFTNFDSKNWPLERYLQLADYWSDRGVQIIFGGGPNDVAKLKEATIKYPFSAGKADLLTTAALTKFATLTLGGDTGLLHLAVALGKQVLMLMGPTRPEDFAPYNHPEWVIRPQNSIDITQIDLETVLQASIPVLANHLQ